MVLAWFLPVYYENVAFGEGRDAWDYLFSVNQAVAWSGERRVTSWHHTGTYAHDPDFSQNGTPVLR